MTVIREGVRGLRRKPAPLLVAAGVRAAPGASVNPARARALSAAYIHTAPAARWRHGQELEKPPAPRMPSRVASGLWALAATQAISNSEIVAAERFRVDYVVGIEGLREPSLAQRSGSADCHDVQILRTEALTNHREIADAIGPRMTAWLVDFVVLDLSLRAMAEVHAPGPLCGRMKMGARMTVVLILLSRLYAAVDRRKRTPGDGALRRVVLAALAELAADAVAPAPPCVAGPGVPSQ